MKYPELEKVAITNNTCLTLRVRGHLIKPRLANQIIHTYSVQRLRTEIHAAYPDGSVIVEPLPSEEVENESQDTTQSIADLGVSHAVEKRLIKAGINTIEALTAMTAQDVIDIKGIAECSLQEIEEALTKMNLSLQEAGNE
ncbi:DNA-directed RNA polymerase subunit alpha C-terminal domain-containing protein [Vibrio marisflavi]|uniref:DNA-directed RNA polymerase subunit alpha n=1 Tax=Vibrio marisflavi CECT 7928 TaxID=634439 RepID=A0ABN8E9T9_9VIBR|nr:DNA-directed RNA polymerase subunit alpha C-terminal domain-containing protein [Vibrio marisflavi]CAH0543040.1 DNA-directed RNA polymerase subunit alpha [Vibrio marisflavi CECT 7928]